MKKMICLLIAAVLAAGMLTACDSGDSSAKKDDQATTVAAAAADTTPAADETAQAQDAQTDRFTFTYKGTPITMKAEAAPICEALGDAKSYTEETSCAFDGLDKNYTFTSFIMTTYPDGDKDRVNSLTLLDDTVSTADKISIGDSKEKVEEVYGADSFNGVNAYILTEGDAQLTVIIDGDKVSSIQYTAVFE
ncbi:MAG: hypothetical protein IJJ17_03990 [Parasporobacterium sp.]|nr:hypothetical protein [Parasporobacterium sp.]